KTGDEGSPSGVLGFINQSEGLRPSDSLTRSLEGPHDPHSARVGSLARSFARRLCGFETSPAAAGRVSTYRSGGDHTGSGHVPLPVFLLWYAPKSNALRFCLSADADPLSRG